MVLGPHRVLGLHKVLGPHMVLDPHRVLGLHRVLGPGSSQVMGPVLAVYCQKFCSVK